MSAAAWFGIGLLLLVSILVRVLPTLIGGVRGLDAQGGVMASVPYIVLVNLVAVCVLAEMQANFWPATAGFGVAGFVAWRWPGCNLLVTAGVAVGAYLAVAAC